VTPLEGIRARAPRDVKVEYQIGCWHQGRNYHPMIEDPKMFYPEAIMAAERADVVVFVGGLSPAIEGEQGDASNSDASGDRSDIQLPAVQRDLLKKLVATGKPVIFVLMSGSAVAIGWEHDHV